MRGELRLALVCLSGSLLLFQNCAHQFSASSSSSDSIAAAAAVCSFNGQTVAEGAEVSAFLTSTVAVGQTCQAETRRCVSGALGGTSPYAFCAVGGPAACLFNGVTVASGSSVTAFLSGSGPGCQSETRTCTNGVLSGSFAYGSCTGAATEAPCLFGGRTIKSGQSVIAFASGQVPAGQVCEPKVRVCQNGALSGSGDYSTCSVGGAASCLFNGSTVPSGTSIMAYATSTVPAGQTCAPLARTCNNGNLSGSGDFASCTMAGPAACLINGTTVASGSSITLFKSTLGPRNVGCLPEKRTCANGVLSGSAAQNACNPSNICYQTGGTAPVNICHDPNDEGTYFQPNGLQVAYGVQIMKLGPQNYRTVYHTESRDAALRGVQRPGDSIKAAGAPGPFNYLMPGDSRFIIYGSTDDRLSTLYYGPNAPGVSGGANPMTIVGRPGDAHYYTFFLSVIDGLVWGNDSNYRHALHVARTTDFYNYEVLSSDPNGQRVWYPFNDAVPGYYRRPLVLTDSNGAAIMSNVAADVNNTQGLIGSMTIAADGTYYHFYTDRDPAAPNTMHLYYRLSTDISGGAWSPAIQVGSEAFPVGSEIMVHKAKGLNRWAVSYTCYNPNTSVSDLCLQYTENMNVVGPGGLSSLKFYGPNLTSPFYLGLNVHACPTSALRAQPFSMTNPQGGLASPDAEDTPDRGGIITWMDLCSGNPFGAPVYRAGWSVLNP